MVNLASFLWLLHMVKVGTLTQFSGLSSHMDTLAGGKAFTQLWEWGPTQV